MIAIVVLLFAATFVGANEIPESNPDLELYALPISETEFNIKWTKLPGARYKLVIKDSPTETYELENTTEIRHTFIKNGFTEVNLRYYLPNNFTRDISQIVKKFNSFSNHTKHLRLTIKENIKGVYNISWPIHVAENYTLTIRKNLRSFSPVLTKTFAKDISSYSFKQTNANAYIVSLTYNFAQSPHTISSLISIEPNAISYYSNDQYIMWKLDSFEKRRIMGIKFGNDSMSTFIAREVPLIANGMIVSLKDKKFSKCILYPKKKGIDSNETVVKYINHAIFTDYVNVTGCKNLTVICTDLKNVDNVSLTLVDNESDEETKTLYGAFSFNIEVKSEKTYTMHISYTFNDGIEIQYKLVDFSGNIGCSS